MGKRKNRKKIARQGLALCTNKRISLKKRKEITLACKELLEIEKDKEEMITLCKQELEKAFFIKEISELGLRFEDIDDEQRCLMEETLEKSSKDIDFYTQKIEYFKNL